MRGHRVLRDRRSPNRAVALWIAVIGAWICLPGCARSPASQFEDLAQPSELSMNAGPDLRITCPGLTRCFDDVECQSQFVGFGSCQHGYCCSGTLDPLTCRCACNDEVCMGTTLCCTGNPKMNPPPPDAGMLACRPRYDCIGGP